MQSTRRAFRAIAAAELDLLVAQQRAERRAIITALDAALSSEHASLRAAVIARFASQRAALALMPDPGARTAAATRLVAQEAAELARLALDHAHIRRMRRRAVAADLAATHKAQRQVLRSTRRRQHLGQALSRARAARFKQHAGRTAPLRRRPYRSTTRWR